MGAAAAGAAPAGWGLWGGSRGGHKVPPSSRSHLTESVAKATLLTTNQYSVAVNKHLFRFFCQGRKAKAKVVIAKGKAGKRKGRTDLSDIVYVTLIKLKVKRKFLICVLAPVLLTHDCARGSRYILATQVSSVKSMSL